MWSGFPFQDNVVPLIVWRKPTVRVQLVNETVVVRVEHCDILEGERGVNGNHRALPRTSASHDEVLPRVPLHLRKHPQCLGIVHALLHDVSRNEEGCVAALLRPSDILIPVQAVLRTSVLLNAPCSGPQAHARVHADQWRVHNSPIDGLSATRGGHIHAPVCGCPMLMTPISIPCMDNHARRIGCQDARAHHMGLPMLCRL
mmetsp:Transcript_33356/g.70903  ORF Transcript_33356/g.70903 Transcript_33356/m.70903 type:complete len:201 (-) Transcript_33356:471-1073(-)